MTLMVTGSFDEMMRDHYPIPGSLIKQYVVDERREKAWADATCPTVEVVPHSDPSADDCDAPCCSGSVQWHRLANGCDICLAVQHATREIERVVSWLALAANRPPICPDHAAFSDEIAPPMQPDRNPMLAILRKAR